MLPVLCLCVFFTILTVVQSQTVQRTSSSTVAPPKGTHRYKIGILIPFNDTKYNWTTSGGAVNVAVEKATRVGLIPANSTQIIWRQSGCNILKTLGDVMQFIYTDEVDVLIGPPCSDDCALAAYLTAFENVLQITWASPGITDSNKYTTLVRTLGPFNKLGDCVCELYLHFNWKRTAIFFTAEKISELASNSIAASLSKYNISTSMNKVSEPPSEDEMNTFLNSLPTRARIVIVILNTINVRRFLLLAKSMTLTSSEYAYIVPFTPILDDENAPWINNDTDDEEAREAYKSVLKVSLAADNYKEVKSFLENVGIKSKEPPWNYTGIPEWGDDYSPYLHDAIYLWAKSVSTVVKNGGNPKNGSDVFGTVVNTTFLGRSGKVSLDAQGDREPEYAVWGLTENSTTLELMYKISFGSGKGGEDKITIIREPSWRTDDSKPPPDMPSCGFTNELCPEDKSIAFGVQVGAGVAGASVVVIAILIFIIVYKRRKKFEEEMALQMWKVTFEDIDLINDKRGLGSSMNFSSTGDTQSSTTKSQTISGSQRSLMKEDQIFSDIGHYKGHVVVIRHLNIPLFMPAKKDEGELKELRKLNHENINTFIGACITPPNLCILFIYCPKGSVQDILENDKIKLDWMFKYSFIIDMANGMSYLHHSAIKSHGKLKSSNCVVDSRWVLKITDYGLCSWRERHITETELTEHEKFKVKFWTAPELLRFDFPPIQGTQKGDVYGFSIVIWEILFRSHPFGTTKMSPKDIISRLRNSETPPLRPEIPQRSAQDEYDPQILNVMRSSWEEDPDSRPDFNQIKQKLLAINKGKKINIMDNMLTMMEKYANNLEEIVNERTQELIEEKKKTDQLLFRMLPEVVAEKLKQGLTVDPEEFDIVTIFFSDICGFTQISAKSTPLDVVALLNDLYTTFDDIIAEHDVYKVETIGDAYMVAGGAPQRTPRHAAQIANMSLDLVSAITNFTMRHMPDVQLRLRIGLHSGSCVAGVVGVTMPRYCLFGDTINTASKMESHGEGLRIHVSTETCDHLKRIGGYKLKLRGDVEIKGKGVLTTYWLETRVGFDKPLPTAALLALNSEKDSTKVMKIKPNASIETLQ